MKYSAIESILNDFDFEAVHRYMVSRDWNWGIGNSEHIPTIEELRDCVHDLLCTLNNEEDVTAVGTGGFEVCRVDNGAEVKFVPISTWGELE